VYASVFTPDPIDGKSWGHPAPHYTCSGSPTRPFSVNNTDAGSSAEVNHSAKRGLSLEGKTLSGPDANAVAREKDWAAEFTVVLVASLSLGDSDMKTASTASMIKIPGKNGLPILSVDVGPDPRKDSRVLTGGPGRNASVGMRMTVGHGTASKAAPGGQDIMLLEQGVPYMYVFTKRPSSSDRSVAVSRHRLTSVPREVSRGASSTGGAVPETREHLLQFSWAGSKPVPENTELVLNAGGSLAMRVHAVAIFTSAVPFENEKSLARHYSDLLARAESTGAKPVDVRGACAYGKEVCENAYCARDISDWSDHSQLLDSRAECRSSVNEFCKKNNTHPSYLCWDQSDTRSKGSVCKQWRAIMGGREAARLRRTSTTSASPSSGSSCKSTSSGRGGPARAAERKASAPASATGTASAPRAPRCLAGNV